MEVNMMLRYLLAQDWWPLAAQQDYQFVADKMGVINEECHPYCSFRPRRAQGDLEEPHYLVDESMGRRSVQLGRYPEENY